MVIVIILDKSGLDLVRRLKGMNTTKSIHYPSIQLYLTIELITDVFGLGEVGEMRELGELGEMRKLGKKNCPNLNGTENLQF